MRRKTAVITGASSGIGAEFARVFAGMGFRLILTARRGERLEALKSRLDVPCRVITADLSRQEECFAFWRQIEEEHVDIFINNAGFGVCGSFLNTDLAKEVDLIRVNVLAMHILFKNMLEKMQRQGHGRILNVASSAGLFPAGPFMAAYYASKSYTVSLTRAAAQELREQGSPLYVGALCPGPVDTEFNERAGAVFALKGITAQRCVREAIRGMRKKKEVIVPTVLMRLCTAAGRLMPTRVLTKAVGAQQKRKL